MKTIRNIIGKCHFWVLNVYDCLTSKQCEVSVGDIILQRAELDHCQFLLTTRKMDVAAFISGENKSFPYQNTVSRAVYGAAHKEERGNKHFTDLITSYQKKGYDPSSILTVDKECRLIDGNHRMGMNLFMGIERLNVRFLRRNSVFPRNLEQYFKLGIETPFLKKVFLEYCNIQKWLIESGNTFCCLIKGEYENDRISLVEDLKLMVNVLKYEKITAKNDEWGGVLLQFSLNAPSYCILNGKLHSRTAEKIEQLLNLRKNNFGLGAEIKISKSCLEGKGMWENINGYFKSEDETK